MAIARFEKVSLKQFKDDLMALLNSEQDCYENVSIPIRATSGSAGYDFFCPIKIKIKPGEMVKIPTGIRCKIDDDYVLQLFPRSSLGFKYQLMLLNTVGIIDSDYYNADNEGHIIVGLINRGDKTVNLNPGDRFVQGIFVKYYLAEEKDNNNVRHGGFGSTD